MSGATEYVKQLVQNTKNFLTTRQQAYQAVLGKEKDVMAERVLQDLAKFCRANESTFLPDSRAHAVLEGRREVWLRIQNHLNLSTEELWQKYGRRDIE